MVPTYSNNTVGWIRIRMDPELFPGSGSGISHSGPVTLLQTQTLNTFQIEHKVPIFFSVI